MILCGGTLKVPKLQKYFRDTFPAAEILNSISPDEVIAVGAAKQGNCPVEGPIVPHSLLHKEISRLGTSLYYKVKLTARVHFAYGVLKSLIFFHSCCSNVD